MVNFVIMPVGNFYFFALATTKGGSILTGNFFLTREDCEDAVACVVRESQYEISYLYSISKGGQFFFTITRDDGKILAVSKYYRSREQRAKAILNVKKQCLKAKIKISTYGEVCLN